MAAIEPPPPPPPPTMVQQSSTSSGKHHVDYKTLPSPISFEDILRESFTCLRPELFEGMRFDFNKPLNSRFVLSHSVLMGPVELPSQSPETIKVPAAQYEFGANFFDPKMLLIGRLTMDGNLSARLKCDLTDDLILKASAKLTNEPHMSQGTATLDYKGSDYRTQVQLGDAGLIGANYMQSVTPQLALGGELFWSGRYRKSGIGYAARYNSDKTVATAQVATTGLVTLSYVQKATEKVSLATEFMYSYFAREVTAAVGYDCTFRQARVQGKLDSHGCVTAFLEEKLHPGLLLILSAEVDHKNKDYRFGFGFTVGE